MGALARFLLSLGNLIRSGGIKKIEEAIEFAKNEFGEVTPLLQKQIEKVFKTAKKPESGTKKPGDVVELKKQRPIAKDEFEKMLDETFPEMKPKREGIVSVKKGPEEFATRQEYKKYLDEVLGPDDDVFGNPIKEDLLKKFDKVDVKNVTPKSEIDESIELEKKGKELSDSMSDAEIELRGNFPKASDDQIKEMLDETFPGMKPKKEGIVSIVDETKKISKGLGEIKNETNLLPDSERLARGFPSRSVEAIVRTGARELLVRKGIEVGEQDPIDLARQIFGEEVLEKLDNVADEMMMAQSFSDIGKILEREKIVDMQPRKGLDVSKSDELEQITKFDETDRKPNAEGGLNYLMGL